MPPSTTTLRLAIWDEPALDFFARSIQDLADDRGLSVLRAARRQCRDAVLAGRVDVALVPSLTVFSDSEVFDVLPAVAFSSWDFPFARLLLKHPLGTPIRSVAIDPAYPQEALVAKIILKEHYDVTPSFHPYQDLTPDTLSRTDDDAALIVARSLDEALGPGIDLGRDWFELTHYPMVWGVFVARSGEGADAYVQTLRDIARHTEAHAQRWVDEQDLPEVLQAAYREGLRYRLDDLAIASLTTLQDLLYYEKALDEIDPLVFYQVEDTVNDDEDRPLL